MTHSNRWRLAALSVLWLLATGAAMAADNKPQRAFTVVEGASYVKPAPAPVAPKVAPEKRWDIPADTPLRAVLQTWAGREGWSVYWPAAADGSEWITEVAVSFTAPDFQQAVTKLMNGLPPRVGLAATFNRANSPMLLHVSESPNMQEVK